MLPLPIHSSLASRPFPLDIQLGAVVSAVSSSSGVWVTALAEIEFDVL